MNTTDATVIRGYLMRARDNLTALEARVKTVEQRDKETDQTTALKDRIQAQLQSLRNELGMFQFSIMPSSMVNHRRLADVQFGIKLLEKMLGQTAG